MSSNQALNEILTALQNTHERLVFLISRRAAADTTAQIGDSAKASDYLLKRLAQVSVLESEVRSAITTSQVSPATIQDFLSDAWRIGVDYADRDIEAAARAGTGALTVRPEVFPQNRIPRQLVALIQDSRKSLTGVDSVLFRQSVDAYRTVVVESSKLMATGVVSLEQAVAESTRQLANRGIGGFVDKAGRLWQPETYTDMALRTAYTSSANVARLERYKDRGKNLVIVSDNPRECPLCRRWEGKILKIDGTLPTEDGVETAGTVADATAAGLFHPRCRHATNLYTPGLTQATPATADPEGYENAQKINRTRNEYRVLRRRISAAKGSGDFDDLAKAQARLTVVNKRLRQLRPAGLFPEPLR